MGERATTRKRDSTVLDPFLLCAKEDSEKTGALTRERKYTKERTSARKERELVFTLTKKQRESFYQERGGQLETGERKSVEDGERNLPPPGFGRCSSGTPCRGGRTAGRV